MTAFLLLAMALTAAALACVLWPLLRAPGAAPAAPQTNLEVLREQAGELRAALAAGALDAAAHAEAMAELQRQVGDTDAPAPAAPAPPARRLAGALSLLVPLVAAGLYYHVGNPAALAVTAGAPQKSGPEHQVSAADVSTLIQGLSERMRREPANADGWYMLARSYTAIGRYHDAVQAYQRLAVLVPDDAAVLADYADVLATVQDGALAGRPEALVRQALALDPRNVKALVLAGSAAYERGDYAGAGARWREALPLMPADAALRQGTLDNLAAAQRRLDGAAPATGATAAAPAAAPALRGTVRLAPALAAAARPDDTVFIFARAAAGSAAPLAVRRITVAQLPYDFVLDDTQAMTPALRLSGAARVVVTARVSRSGGAAPASGDLEGRSAEVASDARGVVVDIATRRP
jgi:cytochrome c-type biogenesis protein CcmH